MEGKLSEPLSLEDARAADSRTRGGGRGIRAVWRGLAAVSGCEVGTQAGPGPPCLPAVRAAVGVS